MGNDSFDEEIRKELAAICFPFVMRMKVYQVNIRTVQKPDFIWLLQCGLFCLFIFNPLSDLLTV